MSLKIGQQNHRAHEPAQEPKKADKKMAPEELDELEGTEAADVTVDFKEYDEASRTDLFAAAAANYGRKRSTYVPPEIAAQAKRESIIPQSDGSLKKTLEKVAKRLSDMPPPKPFNNRG